MKAIGAFIWGTFTALWEVFGVVVWAISGEFLLRWHANSGALVLFRAIWTAWWIMVLAILGNSMLDTWGHCERHWAALALGLLHPEAFAGFTNCSVDLTVVFRGMQDHPTWFGLVFAAVYTALYTRFAAQWKYLADLYNTMTSSRTTITAQARYHPQNREAFEIWCAGFISDAVELHLALKPTYSDVIISHLANDKVRALYDASNGAGAAKALEERIIKCHPKLKRVSSIAERGEAIASVEREFLLVITGTVAPYLASLASKVSMFNADQKKKYDDLKAAFDTVSSKKDSLFADRSKLTEENCNELAVEMGRVHALLYDTRFVLPE